MHKRVLIQHLSGSRIHQEDTFQATGEVELIIGRDATCQVRYDQDRDDLVSRRHARLVIVAGTVEGTEPSITLTDLQSANGLYVNGLYVNGARVTGTTPLEHGDLVRLGLEGPEFLFKLDPPPVQLPRATRVIAPAERPAATPLDKATRVVSREDVIGAAAAAAPAAVSAARPLPAPASAPVATASTVSRPVLYAAGSVAALCLVGALAWVGLPASHATPAPSGTIAQAPAPAPVAATIKASEIVARYSKAVVQIKASWSLKDPLTQRPLYHRHGTLRDAQGRTQVVPYYIRMTDGRVLPWAVLEPVNAEGQDQPAIGSVGRGTGFVATENGYVVTNRHVAAPWLEPFEGPPGALFQDDGNGKTRLIGAFEGRTSWIPGRDRVGSKRDVASVTSRYEVQFESDDTTVSADLVSTSDRHDVSVIRVNRPFALKRVELKDTYDTIRRGDSVVVLGYPGVTGETVSSGTDQSAGTNGQGFLTRQASVTMSEGAIGNIHRDSGAASGPVRSEKSFDPMGDVYQLTVNSTGSGNSGGPVFNERGEVVAIFYAGREYGGARVTFAVPIRYALALLGDSSAAK